MPTQRSSQYDQECLKLLAKADKIICTGGGVISSGAAKEVKN